MARPKKLFADDQPVIDEQLLTETEIQDLSAEVTEEVVAERKEAAKKALREKLRREARVKEGLAEAQDRVTIDLAPYADRLLINNRAFLQGQTYTVPVSLAQVLREQAQATWTHQSIIDGKNENFYRKARGQRVVPVGESGVGIVNTSQLLRA